MLKDLFEFGMLEVLVELSFAELVRATWLGHERYVSIRWQLVTERLGNEDLPRRVRQMLFGPNHMGDCQVVIVDHIGQMIEAGAIGPLNHRIGFVLPGKFDPSADEIFDHASPLAGHFDSHDRLPALGFKCFRLLVRCGHVRTTIVGLSLLDRSGFPLGGLLLGGGVVPVGIPRLQQLLDCRGVLVTPLRLEVGSMGSVDFGTFIPVDPEPLESVEDRLERFGDVSLLVGVIDPQNELATLLGGRTAN